MQLDSAFDVRAPIDQVWSTLMDFERVAACLPGAQVLNTLSEDAYQVGMKVKLGPVTMQYKGQLEVVERVPEEHRAVLRGKAKEARGQGTAEATARLALTSDGETTRGTVSADVNLSGRAAAMGQGVINTVTEQMMTQFATNLQAMLEAGNAPAGGDSASDGVTSAGADAGVAAGGQGAVDGAAAGADSARADSARADSARADSARADSAGAGAVPAKKAAPRKRAAAKATGDVAAANGAAVTAATAAAGAAPAVVPPVSSTPAASPASSDSASSDSASSGSASSASGGSAGTTARAVAADGGPLPSAPGTRPVPAFVPADDNALDAVALAKAIAESQLREPKKALGLLAIVALLAYLFGKRRGRKAAA
ncbi:SRPBCC family protein [Cryptosporangium arvum]|uniref:SRPBCC family protein n=1 Tax=Cryptosporangium arvum TaxID=80871 RepID=UPI001B803F71|nr:SRPBCC family protein [Cryptosporangium arvum]